MLSVFEKLQKELADVTLSLFKILTKTLQVKTSYFLFYFLSISIESVKKMYSVQLKQKKTTLNHKVKCCFLSIFLYTVSLWAARQSFLGTTETHMDQFTVESCFVLLKGRCNWARAMKSELRSRIGYYDSIFLWRTCIQILQWCTN